MKMALPSLAFSYIQTMTTLPTTPPEAKTSGSPTLASLIHEAQQRAHVMVRERSSGRTDRSIPQVARELQALRPDELKEQVEALVPDSETVLLSLAVEHQDQLLGQQQMLEEIDPGRAVRTNLLHLLALKVDEEFAQLAEGKPLSKEA